jgi:hypothetical protein
MVRTSLNTVIQLGENLIVNRQQGIPKHNSGADNGYLHRTNKKY